MLPLKPWLAWAATALCLGGAACGFHALLRYGSTPGASAQAPREWPAALPFERAQDRPELVLFLHPDCPCSRATLAVLAQLLRELHGGLAPTVVLGAQGLDSAEIRRGPLWELARELPGARCVADADARIAQRFGARTSGDALLYSRAGQLLFHGGLTDARGHAAPGPGVDVLREFAAKAPEATAPARSCASFGCPLENPAPEPEAHP